MKRAVSSASRPRVLTTIAPSKDSWAISLTSARNPCARVINGEERRWKNRLATTTAGNTSSPTVAITTSAATICTTATTIITTTPTAIGSGAIGPQAASTSE